ncbi:MAG: hypothetical protein PHD05_03200 [Sphaerochaetaceae bacterium]|nr:hypothetical protein [Sphaerochaetaceae bacterium]
MRRCTSCKYCIEEDYGYSNYTVEGTEINCLLGRNKSFPIDRHYRQELEIAFAEKCNNYIKGDPVTIDIEHFYGEPWEYSDDPEIIELLKEWVKNEESRETIWKEQEIARLNRIRLTQNLKADLIARLNFGGRKA